VHSSLSLLLSVIIVITLVIITLIIITKLVRVSYELGSIGKDDKGAEKLKKSLKRKLMDWDTSGEARIKGGHF
jgi:hypothetical protein